jgi:diguanylate cyclase (GGDEF)-like protein/PAS domain S-box-containing protein
MLRVLLVEDDESYARLVQLALAGEVGVAVAASVADARAQIADAGADVILADLHLPDAEGPEVVEALVAADPTTAVLVVSGTDGPHTEAALGAGAYAFVRKGGEMDGRMLEAIRAAAFHTHSLRQPGADARPIPSGGPPGGQGGAGGLVRRLRHPRPPEDGDAWHAVAWCAPVGLFRADSSGRCTWANERYLELTGLTADAVLGDGWLSALHPVDRRHAIARWREATADRDEVTLRFRYVRPDGALLRLKVSARALKAGGWIGMLDDETRRYEIERELTESRGQLRSILGASPSAIFLKTPNDRHVLANPACQSFYGRPVDQIIGATSDELLGEENGALVRALDQDVLDKGRARQDEVHLARPDGTRRRWLSVRFPVRDADGVLTGVGVVSTDVTETRLLEEEHAHQRTLLEEAMRIARLVSWAWDERTGHVSTTTDFGPVLDIAVTRGQQTFDEFLSVVDPADHDRLQGQFELARRLPGEYDESFRARSTSGQPLVLRARWRSEPGPHGMSILGTLQDVTLEQSVERALREAEQELRLTFDHAPIGLALTDLEFRWQRVNAAVCTLFGLRPGQLLGRPVDEVVLAEDRAVGAEQLQRLVDGELEAFEVERRCLGPEGSTIRVVFSVARAAARTGRSRGHLILQLLDVTARRDMERRLYDLAETDPLTGLANRRRLDSTLAAMASRLRRSGEAATVVLIDLDGFKEVNDLHGHDAGDHVLRIVAHTIRRRLRQTDLVVRLGGDEFAVLLGDTDKEDAYRVARQILEAVRSVGGAQAPIKQLEQPLSASIGIATLRGGREGAGRTMRAADAALYAAKRAGAGSIRVARDEDAPAGPGEVDVNV